MGETCSHWLEDFAEGTQNRRNRQPLAAGIGRLEIKAATGWRFPPKVLKRKKPAATGCQNWSFGNQGSHWLGNSAEGTQMEETRNHWLPKLVV